MRRLLVTFVLFALGFGRGLFHLPSSAVSHGVPARAAPAARRAHEAPSPAVSHRTGTVRLAAVGDLALAWAVGRAIARDHFDPFRAVRGRLEAADLAFANLETVLSDRPTVEDPPGTWPPHIVGPVACARVIAEAGFDVVSVANNHAFDLHTEGQHDTLAALREARVDPVGGGDALAEARRPVVRTVRGLRVGFLAFAYGTNELPHGRGRIALLDAQAFDAVRALRRDVDILLVSLHWGTEMSFTPRADQVRTAHALIDAGADAILGHHPHVVQSFESYRGRAIAYSLGNFVFGPMRGERQISALLDLEFTVGDSVGVRARVVPIRLAGELGAPLEAAGPEGDFVRAAIRERSTPMGIGWREIDGALEFDTRSQ